MLDEANERTKAKKEEADSLEGMSIMAPTIQRELWEEMVCISLWY